MKKDRNITLAERATAALPLSWGARLNLLPDPAQKQVIRDSPQILKQIFFCLLFSIYIVSGNALYTPHHVKKNLLNGPYLYKITDVLERNLGLFIHFLTTW